jgi:cell division protein FtsL
MDDIKIKPVMKKLIIICLVFAAMLFIQSCHTTKQLNKAISPRDTTVTVASNTSSADSLQLIHQTMSRLQSHYIDYKTFNAKIKVEYEDTKGKQPDITAIVRIMKDSAIWVSLSATIFNVEVYRMLITKDSVILMNTRDKEVQYRSLDYLQEVTEIPFDYKTIQELLIGNPVFLDSTVIGFKKADFKILISTMGSFFKHLITLSAVTNLILHSKLDDVNVTRNRTADITYDDYENKNGVDFSTYREITVSEKNRLDIRLKYKQYEFNKELSVSFKVPKNYKRK